MSWNPTKRQLRGAAKRLGSQGADSAAVVRDAITAKLGFSKHRHYDSEETADLIRTELQEVAGWAAGILAEFETDPRIQAEIERGRGLILGTEEVAR